MPMQTPGFRYAWNGVTSKCAQSYQKFVALLEQVGSKAAEAVVSAMVARHWLLPALDSLPVGVALPLRAALRQCRAAPPQGEPCSTMLGTKLSCKEPIRAVTSCTVVWQFMPSEYTMIVPQGGLPRRTSWSVAETWQPCVAPHHLSQRRNAAAGCRQPTASSRTWSHRRAHPMQRLHSQRRPAVPLPGSRGSDRHCCPTSSASQNQVGPCVQRYYLRHKACCLCQRSLWRAGSSSERGFCVMQAPLQSWNRVTLWRRLWRGNARFVATTRRASRKTCASWRCESLISRPLLYIHHSFGRAALICWAC